MRDNREEDYIALNARLSLKGPDGGLQLRYEEAAVDDYIEKEVKPNLVKFDSVSERVLSLVDSDLYEEWVTEEYPLSFIEEMTTFAKTYNHEFPTLMSAIKFYGTYALRTPDGKGILETYEDRVVANALFLAQGDKDLAKTLVETIITNRYQPATPTFLNAGKKQRGEYVSCYEIMVDDDMNSIGRSINSALQLSKRGGGVALGLTDIREDGAPIKGIEGAASGVVPIMKLYEDSFSYANQLGQRQGAGAVYISAHHPDVMKVLDTKRENADEKVRIKTLSIGLVVPDVTFDLVRKGEDMALFSPYDVLREYGVPLSQVGITENYEKMLNNPRIHKKYVPARAFMQTVAEIQAESGYPYLMFEDNVNKNLPVDGKVVMSNLCVTGDTLLLTDHGFERADDLWVRSEDLKIVADNRAADGDFSHEGVSIKDSTKMLRTARNTDVFTVETEEGFSVTASEWHKFIVEKDGVVIRKPLWELKAGDKLLVQPSEGAFGDVHFPDLAYVAGIAISGAESSATTEDGVTLRLQGDNSEIVEEVEASVSRILNTTEDQNGISPKFTHSEKDDVWELSSSSLEALLDANGVVHGSVPEFIVRGDKETQLGFLSGMFQIGGVLESETNGNIVAGITCEDVDLLRMIQMMLINLGVYSRIHSHEESGGMPSINITSEDAERLHGMLTWRQHHRNVWDMRQAESGDPRRGQTHGYCATVTGISHSGKADVYDVCVEDGHSVIFNGVTTAQCSEILQPQSHSIINERQEYTELGYDVVCNLGSVDVARVLDSGNPSKVFMSAIRALNTVNAVADTSVVPSVEHTQNRRHPVGLGAMNLHGALASNEIMYGSEESIEFVNAFFSTMNYWTLRASMDESIRRQEVFEGFEDSRYADGSYFDDYVSNDYRPKNGGEVEDLFESKNFHVPSPEDWALLRDDVAANGLYNAQREAIPPTGSISYLTGSTPSVCPVVGFIENRKEGRTGRVYVPAYGLTEDNFFYYESAYDVEVEKYLDVIAAIQKHVDQGISTNLFYHGEKLTTAKITKAHIRAWRKGLKTLYYTRIANAKIIGQQSAECVSCAL